MKKKKISIDLLASVIGTKRKGLNLTQEDLGNKTGINRQIIGRIETKKHMPSLEQLNNLLDFLEIEFEEIVEEKSENEIFLAMMGEAKTIEEQEWFEKMISMMLCIRKHERLRRAYDVK